MSAFQPFTVFDVETTGLDPKRGDRIIEIAGIRIENGQILDQTFVELVNPEREIPWEAKRVNKIEDADVATAPTIDQVLPQFLDFAQGSILVAHNAQFDMGFLQQEKECCWGYIELPEHLCTMELSKKIFPHEFRHNLDVLGGRLGLEIPEARHRALPDVILPAKALMIMMEMGNIQTMDQLRKMAGKPQVLTS